MNFMQSFQKRFSVFLLALICVFFVGACAPATGDGTTKNFIGRRVEVPSDLVKTSSVHCKKERDAFTKAVKFLKSMKPRSSTNCFESAENDEVLKNELIKNAKARGYSIQREIALNEDADYLTFSHFEEGRLSMLNVVFRREGEKVYLAVGHVRGSV